MSENWLGRNVFVTGASGLIGSGVVAALLARKATVIALVRDNNPNTELFRSGNISRVEVVSGKLEDYESLERAINKYEIDTVIHLGAQTIVGAAQRNPMSTFESNVRGTYNLLEACRVHRSLVRRVVVASSDKAYGETADLPYLETQPLVGKFPYEVSKSCADLIAQSYFHSYELPVAVARCGNVFGPGDLNWSRVVPGTIRSLLADQAPIIRSDGQYLRDYIYLEDVVDGYLHLVEALDDRKFWGQSFNFSHGDPLKVLEIVAHIQKIMDKMHIEPDIQNTATGEIRDQYLSVTKAQEMLGWQSKHSIEAGLVKTIEWYAKFLEKESL
ncbi:NAD-dependent epimerase/dehydratase family protein [Chloroflexota bacterium]